MTATIEPRTLRPYQIEAVRAVMDYWSGDRERYTPVVVLPTGTGKSTVIATLAATAASMGLKVLLLAHRRELLDQMVGSVEAVAPGKYSTGFLQGSRRSSPDVEVMAASFQTMAASTNLGKSVGRRDVVLVDEMHHSTAPTYIEVLDRLGVNGSQPFRVFAAGFTATASRSDGGLGRVWDSVVYEKSLTWAIKNGYLAKPRGLTVVLPDMDLSSVAIRAGDYAAGELETVMSASVETTVVAMLTHAPGRASIVFAAGVDHCHALAEALTRHGIPAAAVTGAMSTSDREHVYTRFRDGRIQAMVTVQVLTEGADFPRCDCAVMARPTRSQTLYSQMVGRAVRLYPGKSDALVLDLAGTVRDMSLVTLSDLDPNTETRRVSESGDDDPGQDEPEKRERRERIGVANMEEIDLLAATGANWLTTPAGVKFLDCQDGVLIFLWPPQPVEDALVHIGVMHNPPRTKDGWVDTEPAPMMDAVEAAENLAGHYGQLPDRNAPWRSRSTPTAGQIRLAHSLGVRDADDKTKARLSDDISTSLAAKRLDPYVQHNL